MPNLPPPCKKYVLTKGDDENSWYIDTIWTTFTSKMDRPHHPNCVLQAKPILICVVLVRISKIIF